MAIPLLLAGCFEVKDELVLENDGSGSVRLQATLRIPSELSMQLGMVTQGESPEAVYPPWNATEAKKLFPDDLFEVDIAESTKEGQATVIVNARFRDLKSLVQSPYARAHALSLAVESGELRVRALTALEAAARMAQADPDADPADLSRAEKADIEKHRMEMRSEFRITLPAPATGGNGQAMERTVAWVSQRSASADPEDFARKLGQRLEARCSASGLALDPDQPTRLNLDPFAELSSGVIETVGSGPDARTVIESTRFVPYHIRVTRIMDLSGEFSGRQSEAVLTGAVIVPRRLAPERWGELKVAEILDAHGNRLSPVRQRGSYDVRLDEIDRPAADSSRDQSKSPETEERRPVAIAFLPPEWRVKTISQIHASLPLHYPGTMWHLLKWTNAVPTSSIVDLKDGGNDFNEVARDFEHPALSEMGVLLRLTMGMVQNGVTMLMIELGGEGAVMAQAQVYDASGRPWPSFLNQSQSAEGTTCTLVAAGRPQAPLSLAFLLASGGATVNVPIQLKDVPIGGE